MRIMRIKHKLRVKAVFKAFDFGKNRLIPKLKIKKKQEKNKKMPQVSDTPELRTMLEKVRNEDPEFNFSRWVIENFRKFTGKQDEDDLVELSNELEKAKIKEEEAKARQEYLRQKILQVQLKKKEAEDVRRIEFAKIHTREEERERNFKHFIPEVFDIKGKKKMEALAQEFAKSDIQNGVDFLKSKGYTMKPPATKEERKPRIQELIPKSDPLYKKIMDVTEENETPQH